MWHDVTLEAATCLAIGGAAWWLSLAVAVAVGWVLRHLMAHPSEYAPRREE